MRRGCGSLAGEAVRRPYSLYPRHRRHDHDRPQSIRRRQGLRPGGTRHGDWTAFKRYELPDDHGERFDWATKTGRYAHLRDPEEQELHAHDPAP